MFDSDVGRIVAGKYQLTELAGEGGMATVWKGRMHGAAGFSRIVAIKKMKPQFRAMQNYIDMFVEEARVGAEVSHSNIVQVIDFLQDDERSYYLVMEWIDGVDLYGFNKAFQKSGQVLPWGLVAIVAIGALRALAAAHERRDSRGNLAPIIHRDVSPHNLLLSSRGEVKLTDFGLALAKDRVMAMTAPGMVKGKLSYLAPEIVRGKPVSPQADIYALGTIVWESLAGRRLFAGDNDLEVLKKVRDGIVPPLQHERSGLPDSLVRIVNKALAVKPEDRFTSAREFAHALSAILGGAQTASDAQALLARAVQACQQWAQDEQAIETPDPTQPSWEDVEIQFSAVSALPMIEEDPQDIDIWFSETEPG